MSDRNSLHSAPNNGGFYALFAQQAKKKASKKKKNKRKKGRKSKESSTKKDSKNGTDSVCHVKQLADETWHSIFGYLSISDNLKIEETCTFFKRIIDMFGIIVWGPIWVTDTFRIDPEFGSQSQFIEKIYKNWMDKRKN